MAPIGGLPFFSMHHKPINAMRIAPITCGLSFLLLAACPLASATETESEIAAISATVEGFHAALSAGNAQAAAKLLAPDAVVMEGGETQTRSAYVAHHLLEDIKFAKAVPTRRGKTDVKVAGDVAWASSSSVTQGMYQSKALNLMGAELMVLTRTSTGWQIRAIHWSSRSSK